MIWVLESFSLGETNHSNERKLRGGGKEWWSHEDQEMCDWPQLIQRRQRFPNTRRPNAAFKKTPKNIYRSWVDQQMVQIFLPELIKTVWISPWVTKTSMRGEVYAFLVKDDTQNCGDEHILWCSSESHICIVIELCIAIANIFYV